MSIDTWVGPINPLPTITPFTYRDGETQLETLERFRQYINNDLVEFVNTTFASISSGLTDEVNTLIATVNTALEGYVTEANLDASMKTVLENPDSVSRAYLDTIFEAINTFTDAAVEAIIANPESASRVELNTLYELAGTFSDAAMKTVFNTEGSVFKAQLDATYAPIGAEANDSSIAAIIEDPSSATRTELDSLYASSGEFSDAALNVVLSNDGSASRSTLDAAYEANGTFSDTNLETILANGSSASRTELDSVYEKQTNLDASVETLMANGASATRVEMDSIFLHSAGLDTAVEALAANPGSSTSIELATQFAPLADKFTDAALEAVIANPASASRVELNTLFLPRGSASTWYFATPAAMQASVSAAIPPQQGDQAILIGDGTNFLQAEFFFRNGTWTHPHIIFIDDTPSKRVAFITYLVLGTNTDIKLDGGDGICDNNGYPVVYNPLVSGFTLLKGYNRKLSLDTVSNIVSSTGFAGTSVVFNADGTVSLNAITAISLLGAIPSMAIDGTDLCEIDLWGSHVTYSNDIIALYTNTPSVSEETCTTHGTVNTMAGVVSAWANAGGSGVQISHATTNGSKFNNMRARIAHGAETQPTYWDTECTNTDAVIATVAEDRMVKATGSAATAYPNVIITFGSAFTGTLRSFNQ